MDYTAENILREGDAFLKDILQLIDMAHRLDLVVVIQELTTLQGSFTFFQEKQPVYALEVLRPLGVFWERLHLLNRWGGNFPHERRTAHFERSVWID
jgi:hypothetical protein